jgi:predicted ABC-type ATPase
MIDDGGHFIPFDQNICRRYEKDMSKIKEKDKSKI